MGKNYAELYEQLNRLTYKQGFTDGFNAAKKEIVIKQLIDAIIPVRCKDCKYVCFCDTTEILPDIPVFAKCTLTDEAHDPDWFCADGERRTDDV